MRLPFALLLLATAALAPCQAHKAKAKAPKAYDIGYGFKLSLSAKPSLDKRDTSKTWECEIENGLLQAVVLDEDRESKKQSADQLLAETVDIFLEKSSEEVSQQADIVWKGWLGLDVSSHSKDSASRIRCIRVSHKLVILNAISLNSKAPKNVQKIFDSLRLPVGLGTGPIKSVEYAFQPRSLKDVGLSLVLPGTPKRSEESFGTGFANDKLIRYESKFGNRQYIVSYRDIPNKTQPLYAENNLPSFMEINCGAVAKQLEAKVVTQKTYKTTESTILRAEIASEAFAGRIDEEFRQGRLTVLVALVPKALYPSTEVSRFFISKKRLSGEPLLSETLIAAKKVTTNSLKNFDIGLGFKIDFPTEPKTVSSKGYDLWMSGDSDGVYIAAAVSSGSDKNMTSDKVLASILIGMVNERNVTLTKQIDLIKDGWLGLEATGRFGIKQLLWLRCFHVAGKAVMLCITTINDSYPVGARKFLDSLKFPESAGQGSLKSADVPFKRFDLAEAGISMLFPCEPRKSVVDTGSGSDKHTFTRYDTLYGNRAYMVASGNIPTKFIRDAEDGRISTALDALNEDFVKSFGLKVLRETTYKDAECTGLRTEVGDDHVSGRLQIEYRNGRIIMMVAVVPKVLYPSEEVSKFFGSIKTLPKK